MFSLLNSNKSYTLTILFLLTAHCRFKAQTSLWEPMGRKNNFIRLNSLCTLRRSWRWSWRRITCLVAKLTSVNNFIWIFIKRNHRGLKKKLTASSTRVQWMHANIILPLALIIICSTMCSTLGHRVLPNYRLYCIN